MSSRFQKQTNKKPDQHVHRVNMALAPVKGVLSSKEHRHWHLRKGGMQSFFFSFDFYFLTWTFFTSGQCTFFSLVIKVDVQCIFDRPQTGCFSQHKIQVNSCISQNDFLIPQYVKIAFINLYNIMLRGKSQSQRFYTIGFYLYNTLEMTQLQKRRTNQWLPGLRRGQLGGKWEWL